MTQIGTLNEDGTNEFWFLTVYENTKYVDGSYLIPKFEPVSIFKDYPKITQGENFLEFSATAFWGIPDEMKQGDTNNFKCTYLISQNDPSFGDSNAFNLFKAAPKFDLKVDISGCISESDFILLSQA